MYGSVERPGDNLDKKGRYFAFVKKYQVWIGMIGFLSIGLFASSRKFFQTVFAPESFMSILNEKTVVKVQNSPLSRKIQKKVYFELYPQRKNFQS